MAFHVLFSKESNLLIFRLKRFNFHLFSTLLKRRFHPFPCWFPLLFDPLTIHLDHVVIEFQSHAYFFHCCLCFSHNSNVSFPGSFDSPIFQLWHVACHSQSCFLVYICHIDLNSLPPSSLFRWSLLSLATFHSICFDLSSLLTIWSNSFSSLYWICKHLLNIQQQR